MQGGGGAVTTAETPVYSPTTLQEALRILHEEGPGARPLAGGTDAMVKWKDGVWRPPCWVNLLRVRELRFARHGDDGVEVGALCTFADVLDSRLLCRVAPLLVQAARTVGGPQIRNMGTLGGNMGTASPAGDSIPALFALDAVVHVASISGERSIAVRDFFTGPGRTSLGPGELITHVRFAPQPPGERCTFEKLGLRAAHAISLVSAAVRLLVDDDVGAVRSARVALGAVAPTVIRVDEAERALEGGAGSLVERVARAMRAAREKARPITDIRASAQYRRAMSGNLVLRALAKLLGPDVLAAARWDSAAGHADAAGEAVGS